MERHALKKCNKCGEHKDAAEFYPDKRRKEGIRTTCMQCDKASNDAQKMDPAVRAAVIEVGTKTCNTCGEALPISAFTGNRRAPDGFDAGLAILLLVQLLGEAGLGSVEDPTILRTMAAYIEMHTLT